MANKTYKFISTEIVLRGNMIDVNQSLLSLYTLSLTFLVNNALLLRSRNIILKLNIMLTLT